MSHYTLFSSGLLSKWGFNDGDLFEAFMFDFGGSTCPVSQHDLLISAVRTYLVPELKQAVELQEVVTIHNPIRARTVDGRAVDWIEENPGITLEPESVDVSEEQLFALFPGAFVDRWKNVFGGSRE